MAKKKKKISGEYGIIVNCKEANVLDYPDSAAPLVCQIKAGNKVLILSTSNKKYYEVRVSNTVTGFILKEYIKVE